MKPTTQEKLYFRSCFPDYRLRFMANGFLMGKHIRSGFNRTIYEPFQLRAEIQSLRASR